MKKIFTLALASIMLFSCSKEEIWTAQETGEMTINVEQGPQIEVTTKTAIADDYKVNIKQGETSVSGYPKDYSEVNDQTLTFSTGTYTVEAYNITETAALTGNGEARYYGSTNVTVSANSTANVSFICTMANSKVTFVFDETFDDAFRQTTTGEGDSQQTLDYITIPGRTISFGTIKVAETAGKTDAEIASTLASSHSESTAAFFTAGEEALTFTIKATRKSDGVDKTYTQTLDLVAAHWHQVTISASTASGQLGDWNIQVDETITNATHEVEINPYE